MAAWLPRLPGLGRPTGRRVEIPSGQVQPRGSAERGAAGARLRGNNPPVNLIGVARMALRGGNLKWFLGGSVLTSLPCYYLLHQDIFRSQAL